MKKFVSKWVVRLAVLAILAVGAQSALNATLGKVLVQVFSEGSGCKVSVRKPRINYFPLRAKVEQVHLYHPSEGPDRGFRADRIEIELEFLKLFKKKVASPRLALIGSDLKAMQESTALYKVLEFIFSKPPPPATPPPKRWYDFVTHGWKVWFPLVEIYSKTDGAQHVTVGLEDLQVQLDQAVVRFADPIEDPNRPALFEATGTNAQLIIKGAPKIPVGALQTRGQVFRGVWTFDALELRDSSENVIPERTSFVSAAGTLSTSGDGRYDIAVRAELFDQYLGGVAFPAAEYLDQLGPKVSTTIQVGGTLLAPEVSGEAQFEMARGAPLMVRDECAFKEISAEFHASAKELIVENVRAEDVVDNASFTLTFDEQLSFRTMLSFKLDEQTGYLARCLQQPTESEHERLEPIRLALTEALEDSRAELNVTGSLQPLELTGALASEIYVKDSAARSRLQAELKLIDNVVEVQIAERGVVPQISATAPSEGSESGQTRFVTEYHSNVSGVIRYELEKRLLSVAKLSIVRYPAERVLARVAPFLSSEQLTQLLEVVQRESLVDARGTLELELSSGRGIGSGDVRVTALQFGSVGVQELKIPWSMSPTEYRVSDARLETLGGSVMGDLVVKTNGELSGTITGKNFELTALAALDAVSEAVELVSDFSVTLAGTLLNPSYALEATIASSTQVGPPRVSTVSIAGDSNFLTASGKLFGPAAQFELKTPLSKTSPEMLEVKLDAREFPLDELFAVEPASLEDPSLLTGSLIYRGPPAAPLTGTGKLEITALSLAEAGVMIGIQEPIEMSIANQRLEFVKAKLNLDQKQLELRGHVDQRSGWNAQVSGEWSIDQLVVPLDALEQISGEVELDLRVSGPLAEPALEGTLKLREGSVSFPLGKSIVGADEAVALVEVKGDRVNISGVSARVGDGILQGSGSIEHLFDGDLRRLELEFAIDRTQLEPIDNLTLALTGGITLEQVADGRLRIGGTVTILSALYQQKLDLLRLIRNLAQYVTGVDTRSKLPGRVDSQSERSVEFDLTVQAANDMLIETDIAQLELGGKIHVSGTADRLAVEGTIESLDGMFRLGASEFDLVTAKLVFDPNDQVLDPRLDILAETRVDTPTGDTQLVSVSVSGSLGAPKVKFSSDSGLSESEIVSLFGLGGGGFAVFTKGKEEYTFRELIDPRSSVGLRERLAGIAGFTEVAVDTALSEDTGEFVPRVRAKRPVFEDLKFTVQTELAGQQLSTIGLDYPLTPYLVMLGGWKSRSVTSEADTTTGSYSLGLEFKRSFPGLQLLPNFGTVAPTVKE